MGTFALISVYYNKIIQFYLPPKPGNTVLIIHKPEAGERNEYFKARQLLHK